ncbi:MAG TPA: hypothetical protein VF702_09350 [Allosphingosinicella sp.]|jgi:hypothetical protein
MATAYPQNIDIGRVIQRGFGVIGRNAAGFLLAGLVLAGGPNFMLQYLIIPEPGEIVPNVTLETVAAYLGLLAATMFAAGLLQAALVRSSILEMNGRPADVAGSFQVALFLVLPVLGLTIVSGIGIMFGFLLLIVPGIMLMVAWMVAVPVLVEERLGVFGSLSRSAELTKGSRWQVFGLLAIVVILSSMIGAVFAVFVAFDPDADPVVVALINGLAATLSGVIGAAMAASLYVELRTVKEGATADSLAAIFD